MNTISSLFKFLGDTLGHDPSTIKTTDKTLVGGINGAWEIVYPVGSYYETSDSLFDPNVSWGGNWSLETAGKVHIGAGTGYTIGSTGGSKDAVLVSHNHGGSTGSAGAHSFANSALGSRSGATTLMYAASGCSSLDSGSTRYTISSNSNTASFNPTSDGISVPNHSHSITTQGSSATNANMQPYIVVNRWHRTA